MRTPPFEEPENPCYKCGGEGVFPSQFDNEIIWECLDCKVKSKEFIESLYDTPKGRELLREAIRIFKEATDGTKI